MPWQLTYQVQMTHTDQDFHPDGLQYDFGGAQNFAGENPQSADIANLIAAMQTDVTTKVQVGFPLDQTTNLQSD